MKHFSFGWISGVKGTGGHFGRRRQKYFCSSAVIISCLFDDAARYETESFFDWPKMFFPARFPMLNSFDPRR